MATIIKPKKQNLFRKLAGGLVDRGRHNAPRRSPRGLTFEPLEGRQLMATTAISNLLNVPVQFKLQSNSHLVETTGKVSTDLGVVQGLYQGKDPTGTLVAYELVNNTLKEFVPKSPWVTVGTVGQSAARTPTTTYSSPRAVPCFWQPACPAPSSPSWPTSNP